MEGKFNTINNKKDSPNATCIYMSCNDQTASLSVNYVSWLPSELRGKNSAINRVTILESIIGAR